MADKRVELIFGAKDQTDRAMGTVEKGLSGVQKMGVLVGTTLGALGLANLARDFVQVNAEVQKLSASLNTVTGSSEEADKAFAMLRNFATETPFQVAELVDAFIKMKALGLDPNIETMRSFGDTASAMGKSLDQMVEAVADASTGEFERLKEFGIKTKQQGDSVIFTFRGVETEVQKNSDDIVKYLRRLGDEQFAGGMAAQMNTIGGAISNLRDSYNNLFTDIGEGTGANEALVASINKLSQTISDPAFKSALLYFVDLMVRGAAATAEMAQYAETVSGWLQGATPISLNKNQPWLNAPGFAPKDLDGNQISPFAHRGTIGPQTPGYGDFVGSTPSASGLASVPVSSGTAGTTTQGGTFGMPPLGFSLMDQGREDSGFSLTGDGPLTPADQFHLDSRTSLLGFLAEMDGQQVQAASDLSDLRLDIAQREADSELEILQLRHQAAQNTTGALMNLTNSLYTFSGKKNKELFELNKVAGIANAIVSTYTGAAQALASVPYPYNIAAAASVVAYGLAQVASISATSFNSGARAAAGGSGRGTPDSPIVTQPAAQIPATERGQEVNVYIYGNVMDNDKMARDLTESISKALKDGKEF